MRIGIDIKCLRYNNAGIGRYLRCILEALQKVDSENEYRLYTPADTEFKPTNPRFEVVVCKGPAHLPGILWQQTILPAAIRKDTIDVFWGPEQTLPVCNTGRTVRVLTVHDLVYKRFPKTMERSVLLVNRFFGNRSIKVADAICPVSEFTKGELIQFFPKIDPRKLHVVYNGAKPLATPPTTSPRNNNLLFVGSLEPRKNLPALIRALEILHDEGTDIPLTITGPKGWRNRSIHDIISSSSVAKNITHTGYVDDTQLSELYRTCAALVFPSVYEGFGLPVLEALAHRAPVLTTKGSSMEEVAGEFATYFDANDPSSIAGAIRNFFEHRETAEQKFQNESARLKELLERFCWENSARSLLRLFETLATKGGSR